MKNSEYMRLPKLMKPPNMSEMDRRQWQEERKKFAQLYNLVKLTVDGEDLIEEDEDFQDIEDFDDFSRILQHKLEEYKSLNTSLKDRLRNLQQEKEERLLRKKDSQKNLDEHSLETEKLRK